MSRIAPRRFWSDSSRRLTIVFLAVLVPAAATLVWLGVRLLEQDRALWAQRDVERQEAAADAVVRSLVQSLTEVEHRLADGQGVDGALLIARSATGLKLHPAAMVAWTPVPVRLIEIDGRTFAAAEQLEFHGSPAAALFEYERIARSSARVDHRIGAVLRAARINRAQGRLQPAIADYRALAAHEGYAVNGAPADLLARRRLCELLLQAGDTDSHRREADLLARDFTAGRWKIGRTDWELTEADIARWTNRASSAPTQRALSMAVDALMSTETPRAPSGRRVIVAMEMPITVVWRGSGDHFAAAAILPEIVRGWALTAAGQYPLRAIDVSLSADNGAEAIERMSARARGAVRRSAADTGLPWSVAVARGPGWSMGEELNARRRLLMAGLAALGLLLAGGAYLLWRVVQRELAVARLQAEFVSAVSHEFRTPVTSLRHVIELLEEDDDLPRNRRKSFYEVLGRSTERLNRLVESLLDFARMEEGRKPYDLRSIDAVALANGVAAEFERNATSDRHRISVDAPNAPAPVRADESALGHALWNLLDNAVKYSPEGGVITISVSTHPLGAAISVHDSGLGVPRSEQREIFTKFVRGAQAHRLGIKGTGVGLAIVSHIVRAHGGRIELQSEEGKGSTFRLVLPSAA